MNSFLRALVLFVRRDRATRDLENEMRLHRQLRAESLRASGMPSLEADAAAARRFGNATRAAEESRDAWGWRSTDELAQDFRYAVRRLRQRPAFTGSIVAVLALGIGATTAMFSAIDAALLRALPFANPDALVTLPYMQIPSSGPVSFGADLPTFDMRDVRAMRETFSSVAAYASGGLNLADPERPARVRAGVVTANLFSTLGVAPVRGRVFTDEEVRAGGRYAVLSWALWQRQFGGAEVDGKTVPLSGRMYEIVGVMPRGFTFPERTDLWIPMSVPTTRETFEPFRGWLSSTVIARVADNVELDVAKQRLMTRWEQFIASLPKMPGRRLSSEDTFLKVNVRGAAVSLRTELVGDRQRALVVLFGATVLLLLIACVNVTNLLLAHGAARRRELAVRSVLGATRPRVVRQLLVESVVLAIGGAVAGLLLAQGAMGVLRAVMPVALDGVSMARLDLRVLGFATVLAMATGIAFGLWPAFGATRASVADTMKSGGGHGSSASGARHVQRLLVGCELALTVMLLVGAGLMMRSFQRLMNTESGLQAEHVGTLEMSFAMSVTPAPVRVARVDAILDRLRAIPGVSAAGAINDLPLGYAGGISIMVRVEGAPREARKDPFVRYLIASEGYFNAMGIRLERGRYYTAEEDSRGAKVAVVSASMAKQFWPGIDAVGRTFNRGGDSLPFTVVGVVADVREAGLDQEAGAQMYFPLRTQIGANLAFVARSTLDSRALLAALTSAVRSVDPAQAVYNVRTMDQVIGASVKTRRANTILIAAFGVLALAVSALGVFAVTSYAVAQRTREFGIRCALGATGRDLARHVGGEMAWVVVGGIGIGAGLAWAFSRVMRSLLYEVTVHDQGAFVMAPVVLVAAVVAATAVPMRKAVRVNPAEVIRAD